MIEHHVADGIAHIALNRPEKRNALNRELISDLIGALAGAALRNDVRVILLRGAGPDFCAGLDLAALPASSDAIEHLGHAQQLASLYLMMRRLSKPIIAMVAGRAIGGGAGLATAADILLMHENAELRYPEVNFGFVPAIVLSLLRRQVGEKRAFEIATLPEPISAPSAVQLGIANAIVGDGGLDYAQRLAAKPASAITLTKSLLYHIDAMPLETAMHAGVTTNALARFTPDFKNPHGKS